MNDTTRNKLDSSMSKAAARLIVACLIGISLMPPMLWAAAAEGAIPADACDDPWGPALDPAQRTAVGQAVADARAAGA